VVTTFISGVQSMPSIISILTFSKHKLSLLLEQNDPTEGEFGYIKPIE